MVDTTTFRLKSLNHRGNAKCKTTKTKTVPANNIKGNIAVMKALKMGFDGVNSVIWVSLANQSNDSRD